MRTHLPATCLDIVADAVRAHDWIKADRWLERYETARRQHGETAADITRAVRLARAVADATEPKGWRLIES